MFDAAWKRLEGAGFAIGELRRLEQALRIVAGIKVREHAEFLRYHVRKKLRRLGEAT